MDKISKSARIGFVSVFCLLMLAASAPSASAMICVNYNPDLKTELRNEIDKRISGISGTDNISLYSYGQWTDSETWIRNQDFWGYRGPALDFTGVSGKHDDLANHFNSPYSGSATLITPRHYVTADHYKLAAGTKVTFYNQAGQPFTYTVTANKSLAGTDLNIGLLDKDVDASIAKYKVISFDNLEHLLRSNYGEKIVNAPIVVLSNSDKAYIHQITNLSSSYTEHEQYTSGSYQALGKGLVGGDSGKPGFLVIGDELILLFTNFQSTKGQNLGGYISDINRVIGELGGYGYMLSEISLPCFTRHEFSKPFLNPPKNFKAAVNASCNSNSNNGRVTLSWEAPEPSNLETSTYILSVNGLELPRIDVSKLSNSKRVEMTYEHLPVNEYVYTLRSMNGGYLSDIVSSKVSIPDACIGVNPNQEGSNSEIPGNSDSETTTDTNASQQSLSIPRLGLISRFVQSTSHQYVPDTSGSSGSASSGQNSSSGQGGLGGYSSIKITEGLITETKSEPTQYQGTSKTSSGTRVLSSGPANSQTGVNTTNSNVSAQAVPVIPTVGETIKEASSSFVNRIYSGVRSVLGLDKPDQK